MARFSKDEAQFRERACPRDHARLEPERVEVLGPDVTVDRCPRCEGVFLDKNELLRITGDRRLNSYLRDEVHHDSDSEILCPHCGGLMDEEHAAGMVVDVCLSCFGIWLDAGELQALKDRENRAPVERAPGKDDEAMVALDVKRRVQVRGAAEQGRGLGGGVRRRALWLDDAMDELVRRWL